MTPSPSAATWPVGIPSPPSQGVLGWALLVSLLFHLVMGAGWQALRNAVDAHPEWFPAAVVAAVDPGAVLVATAQEPVPEAPEEVEIPLEFIEVDPALASEEPPPESRFYSTASTRAANPTPPKAGARDPFVDGWDKEATKTFRVETATVETVVPAAPTRELEPVREPTAAPMATALPEPARPVREAVQPQPEGGEAAGETRLAKAVVNPAVPTPQPERRAQEAVAPREAAPSPPPAPPRRNRSVSEAREARGLLVGEKMQQDGGVERFQLESSLDVRSSPFADYDRQFIYAVQQRWYQLLNEHHYALDRSGRVVLRFRLQSDGTITDMTQVQSDVGEIWAFVCESAVLTPSPYARWPSDMRRLIGADFREVTFTFRYY